MTEDPVARVLVPRRLLALAAVGATLLVLSAWLVWRQYRTRDDAVGLGPARTAWPMAHCDALHSRRAAVHAPGRPRVLLSAALDGLSSSGLAIGTGGEVVVGTTSGWLGGIPVRATASAVGSDGGAATAPWALDLAAPPWGTPAVRADGGLYVTLPGGVLVAVRPAAGELWRRRFPAEITSPTVAADGTVILGTSGGEVYALLPLGDPDWFVTVGATVSLPPTMLPNGDLVIATDDSQLHYISAHGSVVWTVGLNSAAAQVAAERLIYVAGDNGDLDAYGFDGQERWTLPLADALVGIAIDQDGSIYASGTTSPRDRGGRPAIARPAERGAFLYGAEPEGKLKWSFELEDTPLAPIVTGDGTILVATGGEFGLSTRSRVYAVDRDGKGLWTYDPPDVAGYVSDMVPAGDAILCLLVRGQAPSASAGGTGQAYPGRVLVLTTDASQPQPYSPPE